MVRAMEHRNVPLVWALPSHCGLCFGNSSGNFHLLCLPLNDVCLHSAVRTDPDHCINQIQDRTERYDVALCLFSHSLKEPRHDKNWWKANCHFRRHYREIGLVLGPYEWLKCLYRDNWCYSIRHLQPTHYNLQRPETTDRVATENFKTRWNAKGNKNAPPSVRQSPQKVLSTSASLLLAWHIFDPKRYTALCRYSNLGLNLCLGQNCDEESLE